MYTINIEWGSQGLEKYKPVSDVIIIVDVLSFSTSVDIACGNGAIIYPFKLTGGEAEVYAVSNNAILAKPRSKTELSLSPRSLENIPSETRLVLPSPNGSTLSLATGNILTLSGCLRNCKSVADYANKNGKRITVIPAGEKWPDGSMRFALEDIFGAGAIISRLYGSISPEAEMAANIYQSLHNKETETLLNCVSGIELVERGYKEDVYLAADINVSDCVPVLKDNAYVNGI